MKSFLLAAALVTGGITVVQAQQEADEKYLSLFATIQQIEGPNEKSNPQQLLTTLTGVQAELQRFQKVYPDWNPAIISYRLEEVGQKIADTKARLLATPAVHAAAPTNAAAAAPAQPAGPSAQEEALRAQLRQAQAENQTLQAKLKEALSTQPAADTTELNRAQETIRSLMKENDLLKAYGATEKNPERVTELRQQLAEVQAKYTAEQSRAEKLLAENTSLTRDLKRAGEQDATAMEVLRNQNERLKAQLNNLQSTTQVAAAAEDQAARLKAANAQIATLQAKVVSVTQERDALDKQVQQLMTGEARATNYEAQIRELIQQRDELARQLKQSPPAAAGDPSRLKAANDQIAALEAKVATVTQERDALDKQVQQLTLQVDDLHAANTNYASRIRELLAQRDESTKTATSRKSSRKEARLADEIQTLRARVAADEAKPSPYTAEELALFRQTTPTIQPAADQHSVHELPSGSAELVVSAQRHFSNHEFSAAEADYRKILDHDQNNGLALANLATIELQENKLAEAEKHITTAVAQSPNDAYNLSTLGYLRFLQGKYDDALDVLSRAANLDPKNPEIQNYLGVTLSHKGLRKPAEAALRKAIELSPQYAPAHNNLAVVYLNQDPPSPVLARWHYQKALAAGQPHNPDLEKLLAEKGAPVDTQ